MRWPLVCIGVVSFAACSIDFVEVKEPLPEATVILATDESDSLGIRLSATVSTPPGPVSLNALLASPDSVTITGARRHRLTVRLPTEQFALPATLQLPGLAEGKQVSVRLPVVVRTHGRTVQVQPNDEIRFEFRLDSLSELRATSWDLRLLKGAQIVGSDQTIRVEGVGLPPNPLRVHCDWVRTLARQVIVAQLTIRYRLEPTDASYRIRIATESRTSWLVQC
jgi:hypothetical protein